MILWWGKKKQPDPRTGEIPVEPLKPGERPAAMAGEAGAQGPRDQGEPRGLENVPHAGRTREERPVRVPRVAGGPEESMALRAWPGEVGLPGLRGREHLPP